LHASSLLSFSDEARSFIAASPPVEVTATRSSFCPPARPVGNGGASLTGFSRATRAWDRPSAGSPAHAVTAVTAVPRRDPATSCRSLGGHDLGDDLSLARRARLIVGTRIPCAVTAVITEPSASFRHLPWGHGPPWPPRPP
jgi:hypothetical protein